MAKETKKVKEQKHTTNEPTNELVRIRQASSNTNEICTEILLQIKSLEKNNVKEYTNICKGLTTIAEEIEELEDQFCQVKWMYAITTMAMALAMAFIIVKGGL